MESSARGTLRRVFPLSGLRKFLRISISIISLTLERYSTLIETYQVFASKEKNEEFGRDEKIVFC